MRRGNNRVTRNQMAIDRRKQLIRDYSRKSEIRPAERSTLTETLNGVDVRNKTELPLEGGQIEYGFLIVTVAQHRP